MIHNSDDARSSPLGLIDLVSSVATDAQEHDHSTNDDHCHNCAIIILSPRILLVFLTSFHHISRLSIVVNYDHCSFSPIPTIRILICTIAASGTVPLQALIVRFVLIEAAVDGVDGAPRTRQVKHVFFDRRQILIISLKSAARLAVIAGEAVGKGGTRLTATTLPASQLVLCDIALVIVAGGKGLHRGAQIRLEEAPLLEAVENQVVGVRSASDVIEIFDFVELPGL